MRFIYGIFVIIFASTALAVNQIPDQFVGKWSVEKSDNFDEFLTAKGYGWLMRTLVKNSGMTKVFEKSGATFNYKILTPTKDVIWNGIHFGQPYVGEYLDDSRHQVIFTYDPREHKLVEEHVNLDKPNERQDSYSYTIQGPYLVNRLEYNGVVSNRYFRKVA